MGLSSDEILAEIARMFEPFRKDDRPITLETEYLHVVPKTERADTDRRVTIREPRGIIEAVGLELDNKTKTLKLKSKVQGSFEPRAIPVK